MAQQPWAARRLRRRSAQQALEGRLAAAMRRVAALEDALRARWTDGEPLLPPRLRCGKRGPRLMTGQDNASQAVASAETEELSNSIKQSGQDVADTTDQNATEDCMEQRADVVGEFVEYTIDALQVNAHVTAQLEVSMTQTIDDDSDCADADFDMPDLFDDLEVPVDSAALCGAGEEVRVRPPTFAQQQMAQFNLTIDQHATYGDMDADDRGLSEACDAGVDDSGSTDPVSDVPDLFDEPVNETGSSPISDEDSDCADVEFDMPDLFDDHEVPVDLAALGGVGEEVRVRPSTFAQRQMAQFDCADADFDMPDLFDDPEVPVDSAALCGSGEDVRTRPPTLAQQQMAHSNLAIDQPTNPEVDQVKLRLNMQMTHKGAITHTGAGPLPHELLRGFRRLSPEDRHTLLFLYGKFSFSDDHIDCFEVNCGVLNADNLADFTAFLETIAAPAVTYAAPAASTLVAAPVTYAGPAYTAPATTTIAAPADTHAAPAASTIAAAPPTYAAGGASATYGISTGSVGSMGGGLSGASFGGFGGSYGAAVAAAPVTYTAPATTTIAAPAVTYAAPAASTLSHSAGAADWQHGGLRALLRRATVAAEEQLAATHNGG